MTLASPAYRQPLLLECNARECKAFFIIERSEPAARVGAPCFCPLCGQPANARQFTTEEYAWEVYAKCLDLSLELTKDLYELWVEESCPGGFFEYVEQLAKESSGDPSSAATQS